MPTQSDIIYEGEYQVGAYDIDSRKQLSLPALSRMMHEAAMQHVLRLKLSVWDLESQQISWVLMRKRLDIYRVPVLGETLRVVTHPSGFQKYFTFRDFKVYDEQGQTVATASSTWMLMDTVQRRMARIPEFIRTLTTPDIESLPQPDSRLPKFGKPDAEKQLTIGWFDLDWNEHLNNIHYLLKMLDTLPLHTLRHQNLRRLDIIYKAECRYGETITSQIQDYDEGQFLHRILSEAGKEIAVAKTHWI